MCLVRTWTCRGWKFCILVPCAGSEKHRWKLKVSGWLWWYTNSRKMFKEKYPKATLIYLCSACTNRNRSAYYIKTSTFMFPVLQSIWYSFNLHLLLFLSLSTRGALLYVPITRKRWELKRLFYIKAQYKLTCSKTSPVTCFCFLQVSLRSRSLFGMQIW